jgi:hypothetical protein
MRFGWRVKGNLLVQGIARGELNAKEERRQKAESRRQERENTKLSAFRLLPTVVCFLTSAILRVLCV